MAERFQSPAATRLIAFAIASLTLLAGIAMSGSAVGKNAKILGNEKAPPPSCPKNCSVYASVTGFQIKADGERGVFKAPGDGRIVAWSVEMSKPKGEDIESLNSSYGKPAARIAILKNQGKNRFKLTKQSPIVDLASHYNETPIFTLKKPLTVKKGRVIALTTKSWLPNFAFGSPLTSSGDQWKASRKSDKCEKSSDLAESKPHRKVGSSKKYGCKYDTARILYRAWFVPNGGNKN